MSIIESSYLGAAARVGEHHRRGAAYWRSTRATRTRRLKHLARLGMVLAAVFFLLPFAQMALAVDGKEFTGPLASITATDHLNNPVAAYELSVDEGQMYRAQEKIFPAMLLDWMWTYYAICVGNALMLVNLILEFKFVTWLEGPAQLLESTLSTVIDQLGLLPMVLTIAAAIAGWHALRGRIGTAITQFVLACTVGALAGGLLSSPVGLLSGPDGALQNASTFGGELTAELMATDPETGEIAHDEGGMSNTVTTELVQTFIRLPHQLINYGANLDEVGSEECVNTYNDMLGKSPWGRNSGFRDNVGSSCGPQYKETAIEPVNLLPTALLIAPSGAALTLAVLVLALAVMLACVWALIEGAMLVVHLLKGVLPGEGRADMWRSVGIIAWSVLVCGIALFCLALLVLIIRAVYDGVGASNPYMVFGMVNLMLLVGAYFFCRYLMGLKKKGKRLGDMLHAATGGGAPTTAQSSTRWVGAAAGVASASVSAAHLISRRIPSSRPSTAATATASGGGPRPSGGGGGYPPPPPPPPGGGGPRPAAGSPQPVGGGGPRPSHSGTRRVASGLTTVGLHAASLTPAAPAARAATVARHTGSGLRRRSLDKKLATVPPTSVGVQRGTGSIRPAGKDQVLAAQDAAARRRAKLAADLAASRRR